MRKDEKQILPRYFTTDLFCINFMKVLFIYYLTSKIIGEEMAPHSSTFAWWISGTGEPAGLLSMGSHRVGHDWSDLAVAILLGASLVVQMVKYLPTIQETWVRCLGWENPRRREWQPTPVFLPGEFHGQRNLAGYSSHGHKELDTTKWLTLSAIVLPTGLHSQRFLLTTP